MAQPATTPASFEFSPPLLEVADPSIQPDVQDGNEGPANRALTELSLALSADHDAERWSTGKSLRFILASCGLFWSLGAIVFYALR